MRALYEDNLSLLQILIAKLHNGILFMQAVLRVHLTFFLSKMHVFATDTSRICICICITSDKCHDSDCVKNRALHYTLKYIKIKNNLIFLFSLSRFLAKLACRLDLALKNLCKNLVFNTLRSTRCPRIQRRLSRTCGIPDNTECFHRFRL
jgi:hypothetical protein